MPMETDHGPDQEPEKYSFLQEKIKDEAFSRKKVLYKISWLVGKGLLFGVAASIGFFALKPWAESTFQKNPDKIEIPKDEDTQNTPSEDTQTTQEEFTIEKYKELNSLLTQTALEAKKSVVEVSAVHEDENLLEEDRGADHKVSGVIVADNGQELLILTEMDALSDASELQVKFVDNTTCTATVKKKDANIGMAIVGVDRSLIKDTTWDRIKVAELGNSNVLSQGKTVIALGNPFGYSDGMGIGIASSVQESVMLADGEYKVIVTDMPKSAESSGILFNIDGAVVGIIAPDLGADTGVLSAYGISSIKSEIELMSNAKEVPYIGIVGTMITEDIATAQNIPEGFCVTEVEADSPAMKAGIQNGDIITHIDKKKIESVIGYHSTMITQDVGTEVTLTGQRRGAEEYVEIHFTVTIGIKE